MNAIVSQVGEICRYSERHRLSTQGQNPLGRNLKDIPVAVGRGTFESMNHGFNGGAQRPTFRSILLEEPHCLKRWSE